MRFKKSLSVAISVFMLTILLTSVAKAVVPPPMDATKLKAFLRTATPEEKGFIDGVVLAVNEGDLSRSLVESTLFWARKKAKYRFQYFKYGLLRRLQLTKQPIPAALRSPQIQRSTRRPRWTSRGGSLATR